MGTGAYLVRTELRRRWRSILLTALLVALVTGTVLTAVSGARRTRTAFDRYLETVDSVDLVALDSEDRVSLDELEALRDVEAAVGLTWYAAFPSEMGDGFYPMFVPNDPRVPDRYLHPPLVAGRRPDPGAPHEVALGERTARRLGVGVGDELAMISFSPAATTELLESPTFDAEPDGPTFDLSVVGLIRNPGDIASRETDIDITLLTPAFGTSHRRDIGVFETGALVIFDEGAESKAVAASVAETGSYEIVTSLSDEETRAPIDPILAALSVGLYLFAAIAGLAGTIAIVQAWARSSADAAEDHATLRSLGVGGRSLAIRLTAPWTVAVVAGVPLGMAASVLVSPLLPVGVARRAEPDPGIDVDPVVLLGGGVLIAAVLLGMVVALAFGVLRREHAEARSVSASRVANWAAASGSSVPAVTGLRLALEAGRGRRSVPNRAAVGATFAAVAGVLAAVIVGASLDHAVTSPGVYGWGWDAAMIGRDSDHLTDGMVSERGLAKDASFAAVAELIDDFDVTVTGTPEFSVVLDDLRGHTPFVVVDGREPRGSEEVALAGDTLDAAGVAVGDTVRIAHGDRGREMRVVGTVALPVSVDGGSSAKGVAMRRAAADSLGFSGSCDGDVSCSRQYALTGAPGDDLTTAAKSHIIGDARVLVEKPVPPPDIERLTAVSALPWILAGFLSILGVVAVAHAAMSTVRRRRRDLALLRVLGFTGSQLRTSISVQVLTLAAIGTVAGTLVGVVVGRQVWARIADALALPVVVEISPLALVGIPVVALVLAELAATVARRRASSIRPAASLHTE